MNLLRLGTLLVTTASLAIACGRYPDVSMGGPRSSDAYEEEDEDEVTVAADPADPPPEGEAPVSFTTCAGKSKVHETFNAFFSELDRKYAVFPQRLGSRSWAKIGADACAKLTPDITPTALYELLLGMAKNLDDAHTVLTAEDLDRDDDAWVTAYPHYDQLDMLEENVNDEYIDGELKYAAEDEIAWGRIGTVGYISITSMDTLSAAGDDEDADRAAANAAMKAAMADLRKATGLIIDVRANTGGYDTVSLDIARWISGPRALAWSKQIRNGPKHTDYSAPVPTYVEPSVAGAYAGPVVLLTSRGTLSAAETFTLAMSTRPSVTILGEPGSGHFSDMWDVDLPNGWTLDFSGELYTGSDGKIHEGKGFPVDVSVPFDQAARDALEEDGRDVMLEAALALLKK